MTKKLQRDEKNKMVGGVLAGFSNYFKNDVTVWRIGVVALAILTGILPVVVFYLVSWFIMPDKDNFDYEVVG